MNLFSPNLRLSPGSLFLLKCSITLGCILQMVTLIDCHFLHVIIGFTPSNPSWKYPTIDVGLWLHQSYETDGCKTTSNNLESLLMSEDDMTWKVARASSILACCASGIALAVVILLELCPGATKSFSILLILPLLCSSILAETAKFVILHSSICKNRVWIPFSSSRKEAAEDCILARSAYFSLVSLATYLIVCFVILISNLISSWKSPHILIPKGSECEKTVGNFETSLVEISFDDSSTAITGQLSHVVTGTHDSETPRTCNSSLNCDNEKKSLFFCPYTATSVSWGEKRRNQPSAQDSVNSQSTKPMKISEFEHNTATNQRSTPTRAQGKLGKSLGSKWKLTKSEAACTNEREMINIYGTDAFDLPQPFHSTETLDHCSSMNLYRIQGVYALDLPSPRERAPTDDVMTILCNADSLKTAVDAKTGEKDRISTA